MKRAFSYERVSSSKQAASGRGLERQGASAISWCRTHGYQLDDQLGLSDRGRSAFHAEHLKRGALGQFLELAKAGALGDDPVLLVEAIDRLSRQEPLDALETILQGLVGSGVRIVTLEDGAEYSRQTLRTDPTRLIVLVVKVQAAHEYSARLSMRMKASWAQIRDKAAVGENRRGARRPFWIDYDKTTDSFRLNDKAAVVLRIFELLEAGNGIGMTARGLNAEGFTTPGGEPWNTSRLRWLLRTELVSGTVTFQRKAEQPARVEGYYPAVIGNERREAAMRLMRGRSKDPSLLGRRSSTNWIGQGITYCVCGSPVGALASTKTSAKKGTYTLRYLHCKDARYKPKGEASCQQRSAPLRDATAHVLVRLKPAQLALLFEKEGSTSSSLSEALKARDTLSDEIAVLKAEANNAANAVKAAAKSGGELALLRLLTDAVTEVEQQIEEKQRALNEILVRLDDIQRRPGVDAMATELHPALTELMEAFIHQSDTPEQRREVNGLLRRMGVRIIVNNEAKEWGLSLNEGPVVWGAFSDADLLALEHGDWGRRTQWKGDLLVDVEDDD